MSGFLRPIRTEYRATLFRSRTEARWAVWFDVMGWVWNYEPEVLEVEQGMLYAPDFWIEGEGFYCEVKPCEPTALEIKKMRFLPRCLLLQGTPDYRGYWLMEKNPLNETLLLLDNPIHKAPMNRKIIMADFGPQYHEAVNQSRFAKFDGYDDDRKIIRRRYQ